MSARARALRVVLVGARGRMGRFSAQLLREAEGFELVAELDVEHDLERELGECDAELGLELTVAGRGHAHGMAMLRAGVRPVIGTSGVSLEENQELDRLARAQGLGGLVVPNFSLGMQILQQASLLAASCFESCEIVELHHAGKKDAPSGTSLDTAERIAARGGREASSIPIHSVRLPGLYSHQAVLFGARGETLTLRHDMSGPEAFGEGILLALRHAAVAQGVGRGLGVALGGDSST
jgi:4-hydroxy-tetrahydrodipicolinate reductase